MMKRMMTLVAAAGLILGTALLPSTASAQRGGHGGGPGGGGGVHGGGGAFRGGAGGAHFGAFRAGRGWGGVGWGYGGYPWAFGVYAWPYEYYEPTCSWVLVKYYKHKRAYWRHVYTCE